MEYGCTWSIYKFFAGRSCNIVSGFRAVLDPSGISPPQIGPDPEWVKQFSQIKPPTTVKDVRSFLGFIAYLGKFFPDYALTINKLRSLTNKGVKFCWTESHQKEFDYVIQNLSKLEFLHLYQKGNKLYAMTDASLSGLGFILYQKDSTGHCSIVQVGSTCLKNFTGKVAPS